MNIPITYLQHFIEQPTDVANVLWNELQWLRHDKVPRSEYYCNESNVVYKYGIEKYARTYLPQEWHPQILTIKAQLEEFTKIKFEVCFLNGYSDQSDHLGWHADDSPEMDDNRPIAIISLGVEREIWFKENNSEEVHKVLLQNGSLCLMHAGMQDTHKHRIPKASFTCGKRISLTFRGYKEV